MERESPVEPSQLTGIHINLEEHAIEFEDHHGTIGRLVFGQATVLYEGQPLLLAPTDDPRGGGTLTSSAEAPARADPAPHPARTPAPHTPRRQV
jgi:hypothetical protein